MTITGRLITTLSGAAYEAAIKQVIEVLNMFGTNFTYRDNTGEIESICNKLGIKFDWNGNIVK